MKAKMSEVLGKIMHVIQKVLTSMITLFEEIVDKTSSWLHSVFGFENKTDDEKIFDETMLETTENADGNKSIMTTTLDDIIANVKDFSGKLVKENIDKVIDKSETDTEVESLDEVADSGDELSSMIYTPPTKADSNAYLVVETGGLNRVRNQYVNLETNKIFSKKIIDKHTYASLVIHYMNVHLEVRHIKAIINDKDMGKYFSLGGHIYVNHPISKPRYLKTRLILKDEEVQLVALSLIGIEIKTTLARVAGVINVQEANWNKKIENRTKYLLLRIESDNIIELGSMIKIDDNMIFIGVEKALNVTTGLTSIVFERLGEKYANTQIIFK